MVCQAPCLAFCMHFSHLLLTKALRIRMTMINILQKKSHLEESSNCPQLERGKIETLGLFDSKTYIFNHSMDSLAIRWLPCPNWSLVLPTHLASLCCWQICDPERACAPTSTFCYRRAVIREKAQLSSSKCHYAQSSLIRPSTNTDASLKHVT